MFICLLVVGARLLIFTEKPEIIYFWTSVINDPEGVLIDKKYLTGKSEDLEYHFPQMLGAMK